MGQSEPSVSARVIYTVAEAYGEDPLDLPPLEETISSDALDGLFGEKNLPPGAHLIFPYYGVWVVVHSNMSVDVFKEYVATSGDDDRSPVDADRPTDERQVILHAEDDRHIFRETELETLHEIIDEADDCEEAWDDVVDYAEQR